MESRRRRRRPNLHMAGPSSREMADMLVAVGEAAEKANGRGVYVGRDGRGHRGAPGHEGGVDQDFVDAPSSS